MSAAPTQSAAPVVQTPQTASGIKRVSTASLIAIISIVVLVVLIVLGSVMAATLSRVKKNARRVNIPFTERKDYKHMRIVPKTRTCASTLPKGVTRTVISNNPILDTLFNLLSQKECEHLIAIATPRFRRSVIVEPGSGVFAQNKDRTSSTVFLERDETNVVTNIQNRLSQAAGMPAHYMERLQVVRYKPGEFYKPHFDYLESTTKDVAEHGQRVITLFVYLNNLPVQETGGGTRFPYLNTSVRPEMGKGALWHDVTSSGNVDPRTLHSGEALAVATKYGLNCWWRDMPQIDE